MDFCEEYWREQWQTLHDIDSAREELHDRLREPSRKELFTAFERIGGWYKERATLPDWDGGDVGFAFAGHGVAGDGSLCLRDGILPPDEFVDLFIRLRHHGRKRRALRLNVFLDCCHSGAFLLRVLSRIAGTLEDSIYIYTMWASCMPDENVWETDETGHGLFTFCFSHRGAVDNVYTAEAVRADNSFGPSLRIATGGYGCSIVSLGRQNPVVYMGDGTGSLEVCGSRVVLPEGPLDEGALEQQLSELRLEFLQHSEILTRKLNWSRFSEEELRFNLRAITQSRNRR